MSGYWLRFTTIVFAAMLGALSGCRAEATDTVGMSESLVPTSTLTAGPSHSPQPTPGRTPAHSPTLRPTATPTLVPTAWWGARPPQPVEAYTLTTWDAGQILAWANHDLSPFPTDTDGPIYTDWSSQVMVTGTLYSEIVGRYPDSPEAESVRRLLLNPDTPAWTAGVPSEPFRAAFDRRLNADRQAVLVGATLVRMVHDVIGPADVVVGEPVAATNLLGDGEPGWLVDVRVANRSALVLGISGRPEAYRVVVVDSQWSNLFHHDHDLSFRDLNANGQPEVVIRDLYWGSGFSHFCASSLAAHEWADGGFRNLTPGLATYAETDFGDCLPIEIEASDGAPATITTGYALSAGCTRAGQWTSHSILLRRRYAWAGSFFDLAEESLLAPADFDFESVDSCALPVITELGIEDTRARALLARVMASDDEETMTANTERYGPAYHDFFRVKLGIAQALAGDSREARETLIAVRDSPQAAEYTAASQLAGAFVAAYDAHGVVAGCLAVADVLDPRDFPRADEFTLVPYDTDAMREVWGFADGNWGMGGRPPLDSPWLQTDPLDMCSPAAALRVDLNGRDVASTPALVRYLEDRAIPYSGLQEADVDGDGRRDWVVLLGTGRQGALDLWALLNRAAGIDAQWVAATTDEVAIVPSVVAAFAPDPAIGSLTIYQWSGGIAALRAIPVQGGYRVVDALHSRWLPGPATQRGFVIATNSDGAQSVTVRLEPHSDWDPAWYTVGWSAGAQAVVEVDRQGSAQRARLREVERLLFDAHDPAAAAALIDALFADGMNMPASIDPGYSNRPTFRPYLRYLQGLAAEALGDPAGAVVAYWTLWNEYPLYPLSAIAQSKLGPIEPMTSP